MTKITTIDKKTLIALRDQINAALAPLGAELGLSFHAGNGSYGGANGHFKLEIKVDDPAVVEAAERQRWEANCRYIGIDYNRPEGESGLRPEDFGTEFEMKGVRYKATHLAIGRSKYPVGTTYLSGPKAGQKVLFTDLVVPLIRAATDAAKAKATA